MNSIMKFSKRNRILTFLISIASLNAYFNYIWLKNLDISHPIIYPHHVGDLKHFYDILKDFNLLSLMNFVREAAYAPIHSLFAAFLAVLFNRNYPLIVIIQNSIYLFLTSLFLYLIVRKIDTEKSAVLSVIIMSLYPLVGGMTRIYAINLGLTTAVTASIYFLIKSDYFSSKKWSVFFGISMGVGLLTKYPYVAFVGGPLLYVIGAGYRRGKLKYTYLITAFVTALIIAAPRYFSSRIIFDLITDPLGESVGPWYMWRNLRVYTLGTINQILSPPFFLLLILGGIFFFKKYENRQVKTIFLLWILLPWLSVIFMPAPKKLDLILPCIPAVAAVTSVGINRYGKKCVMLLTYAIILFGIVQYFEFSFGPQIGLKNIKIQITEEQYVKYYKMHNKNLTDREPYEKSWVVNNKILDLIQNGEHRLFIAAPLHNLKNKIWFKNANVYIHGTDMEHYLSCICSDSKAKLNNYDLLLIPKFNRDNIEKSIEYLDELLEEKFWVFPAGTPRGEALSARRSMLRTKDFAERYRKFLESMDNFSKVEVTIRFHRIDAVYLLCYRSS